MLSSGVLMLQSISNVTDIAAAGRISFQISLVRPFCLARYIELVRAHHCADLQGSCRYNQAQTEECSDNPAFDLRVHEM